jgi:single-strand DNA-binding protein
MSVNLAVVRGTCSSPAEVRVLSSGSALALLQLTARVAGAPAVSVPVIVWEPTAAVERLDTGDDVVVLGRVRRRFFRTGAGTASRVEIEADAVVPARDGRRVRALVRRATTALEQLVP